MIRRLILAVALGAVYSAAYADKWLVVLAVVGLSTLSWWMPIEQGPVSKLVTVPEKRHIPEFYLTDFDLTTMNAAGIAVNQYFFAFWASQAVTAISVNAASSWFAAPNIGQILR